MSIIVHVLHVTYLLRNVRNHKYWSLVRLFLSLSSDVGSGMQLHLLNVNSFAQLMYSCLYSQAAPVLNSNAW